MTAKVYPVSEIFNSVQGEGYHAGRPMVFIRLAGCSVGKPIAGSTDPYEMCKTWDGREFLCDTDYRVKERLSIDTIRDHIPWNMPRVCLTGGEPLIHDVVPLVNNLDEHGITTSIETSGTVAVPDTLPPSTWITISPKFNARPDALTRADEIKLLVDDKFDEARAMDMFRQTKPLMKGGVWLQPVNGTTEIDHDNLQRCLTLLKRHTAWRLSTQMHKVWNVR